MVYAPKALHSPPFGKLSHTNPFHPGKFPSFSEFMMQLRKTLSPLLPFLSHQPKKSHLLHPSPISTKTHPPEPEPEPEPEPHFMVDYLITSVGLSPDRAARASKHFTHLTSTDNPDSVLQFLKTTFPLIDAARLRTILSWHPSLLLSSVSKTLRPRTAALQLAGFSPAILAVLLRSNPTVLTRRNVLPMLTFWRDFLAGDENKLLNLIKRNRNLIGYDIDRKIAPNIALLREFGLKERDILVLLTRVSGFILRSPATVRMLIERTEALGFARGTGMFVHGLAAAARFTTASLERKLEIFRSIGWSEVETRTAIHRFPNVLLLAKKNVERKMSFFVEEVGCKPSEIAVRPILLAYSLEKRLIPRYHVIRILKDLGVKNCQLTSVMHLPDNKFVEKFILPHRKERPDLHEAFVADCAGTKKK